jgi:hypothetical protein
MPERDNPLSIEPFKTSEISGVFVCQNAKFHYICNPYKKGYESSGKIIFRFRFPYLS